MIPVKDIYDSVALDSVNSAENGDLNFEMFNRLSKKAELRLLDYLTGDIENIKPPVPYTSQKLKDFLSDFITKYPKAVEGGSIVKPDDYYSFENMYMIGNFSKPSTCDEDIEGEEVWNTPIELVDGGEFYHRSSSYIVGLRPSFRKPIAKMVGFKKKNVDESAMGQFEFMPKDIGSVVLEYVRYPKFAKIVGVVDEEYMEEVIDETASANYEYGDWARELLVYFISREFSTHTREDSLLQHSQITGKLVRDEK